MKRVVIIGGGIAGLTTALRLRDRAGEVQGGLEVLVVEAGDRLGGNIRTDRVDGFTIEWGPNGYLDNVPQTADLVKRIGLEDQLQRADESASKRYLYRGGRLHLLPSGLGSFLTCGVLSVRGRLRVMAEPFARARPEGVDETIFEFGSRRIGEEAARILIDAMVSGVFAGNVHELSLASTFPKMAEMEAEHGGLVKAMIARMGERRDAKRRAAELRAAGMDADELTRPGGPAGPGGTLTSFRNGLDTFVSGLAAELGDSVRLDRPVKAIRVPESAQPWTLTLGSGELLAADALVAAVPSPLAAPLLETVDERLGEDVRRIPTASLAVVAFGYDAATIGGAPDGFGFLVPRGQGPRILGCLWDSSVFPGRAPEGKVLIRAMIGGAHDSEAVGLDDATLLAAVRKDLQETMGLTAEPILTRIYRHPLGIGQYVRGHGRLLDRIHERLAVLPGLWVAGSSYYGVSMNACIEKAAEQASEILSFLQTSASKN